MSTWTFSSVIIQLCHFCKNWKFKRKGNETFIWKMIVHEKVSSLKSKFSLAWLLKSTSSQNYYLQKDIYILLIHFDLFPNISLSSVEQN